MRLNPKKCIFGVEGGKFLGFMLTHRGIEDNPDKCFTILAMRIPSSLKEVQSLVGRLTSLSRFLPRLAKKIRLIVKTLKKANKFTWSNECENPVFAKLQIVITLTLLVRIRHIVYGFGVKNEIYKIDAKKKYQSLLVWS